MYPDYNSAMADRFPYEEVDSDAYNKLIPTLESNSRVCLTCRRARLEHFRDRCRTIADYVTGGLPTGHPIVRPLVDIIICSCGVSVNRVKINGKTRCYKATREEIRRSITGRLATTLANVPQPNWTLEAPGRFAPDVLPRPRAGRTPRTDRDNLVFNARIETDNLTPLQQRVRQLTEAIIDRDRPMFQWDPMVRPTAPQPEPAEPRVTDPPRVADNQFTALRLDETTFERVDDDIQREEED
jgi:hypothetical protein